MSFFNTIYMEKIIPSKLFAILRIAFGFIFFWAFLDKMFGLGFSTAADKSWLSGVSPTKGFLSMGVNANGPLPDFFNSIAGSGLVDWLFMMGLLCIGLAMILGIGFRLAGFFGAILMFLMWFALVPSKNNPLVDDHVIYFFLFLIFRELPVGDTFGLGRWWKSTPLVKNYPWLR